MHRPLIDGVDRLYPIVHIQIVTRAMKPAHMERTDMTNLRIAVLQYGNEDMHGYAVDFRLTSRKYSFSGEPAPEADIPAFEDAVSNILGVKKADIHQYDVSIEKADAFDWADISPAMIAEIKKLYETRTGFKADPSIRVEDQRPTRQYDLDGEPFGTVHNEPINEGV